jgi:hypothetical protein
MTRIRKSNIGNRIQEILPRIENAGLVDISVGGGRITYVAREIQTILELLAPDSDLFMVGRTFMAWSMHAKGFAKQVAMKSIRCRMIIANPRMNLNSLVLNEQAQSELPSVFKTFERELPIGFQQAPNAINSRGYIEIYGIPAFLPEAFSVLKLKDGREYCNLEIGIAVDPSERVNMYFEHIGKNDVYSSLRHIYENILTHDRDQKVAELLLRVNAASIIHPPDVAAPHYPTPQAYERIKQKRVIRYFISYAHQDARLVTKLLALLKPQLAIAKDFQFEAWADNEILAGDKWHYEIKSAISQCQFGLLLVSPGFLASKFVTSEELPSFVGANLLHPTQKKRAIPVSLKLISFDGSMELKGLEKHQIFHDKRGKSFSQCQGSHCEEFAKELFDQIIKIVKSHRQINETT